MHKPSSAKKYLQLWLYFVILFIFGASSCARQVIDPSVNGSNSQLDITHTVKSITSVPISIHLPTSTPKPSLYAFENKEVYVSTEDSAEVSDTRLEAPNSVSTSVQFKLCSPLAGEEIYQLWEIISDPYNPPPPGRDERHQGVDFSYYRRGQRVGIEGEDIQSILAGHVVAKVDDRLPYGNMVIIESQSESLPEFLRSELKIEDGESIYHLYAHMKEEPLINLGDEIECGQNIGLVGSTGYNIVNAHLHLETRIGPKDVILSPMAFYDTGASVMEMETYRRWRTNGEFVHFDPMLLFKLFLELN